MIVAEPDPVLHERCAAIELGADVRGLVERLHAAMAWSAEQGRPAAGLAAPQIGESVRVFVLTGYEHAFVNPRVLKLSTDRAVANEECLSLPKTVHVEVSRPKWVKLVAQDEQGTARTMKLHGWSARAALHELDHLEGILITDRGEALGPLMYRKHVAA